jgi:hypothetical protein
MIQTGGACPNYAEYAWEPNEISSNHRANNKSHNNIFAYFNTNHNAITNKQNHHVNHSCRVNSSSKPAAFYANTKQTNSNNNHYELYEDCYDSSDSEYSECYYPAAMELQHHYLYNYNQNFLGPFNKNCIHNNNNMLNFNPLNNSNNLINLIMNNFCNNNNNNHIMNSSENDSASHFSANSGSSGGGVSLNTSTASKNKNFAKLFKYFKIFQRNGASGDWNKYLYYNQILDYFNK